MGAWRVGSWRLGFDFRSKYESKVKERQEKMEKSGKRLRAMWEDDAREKAANSLQVCYLRGNLYSPVDIRGTSCMVFRLTISLVLSIQVTTSL